MLTKTKITQSHYDYHLLMQQLEDHGKKICGPLFRLYDVDRPVIIKLLAYFLRDEAVAAAEGLDLDKGILLTGPIGSGKTSLIRLMELLPPDDYRPHIVSCRRLSFQFGQSGLDIINRYTDRAFFPYRNVPLVHCFDDLGLEQIMNHWGNTCNVMGEILLSRYELLSSHKMITHVTTNFNSEELEAKYGNRVRSRMKAMFNLIAYSPESPDKR